MKVKCAFSECIYNNEYKGECSRNGLVLEKTTNGNIMYCAYYKDRSEES